MRMSRIACALGAATLLLAACASPRLVNLKNPGADFDADTLACRKDAERVARLDDLAHPEGLPGSCAEGAACAGMAATRRIQIEAQAFSAQKRCMAAKGWQDKA